MSAIPKQPRWRCAGYISWLKSRPCAISGVEPAGDAHHIIGVGNLSGMGLTAPDWASMPLTRWEHDHMHKTPEEWGDQWEYIVMTINRAIDDGVLVYFAGFEPISCAKHDFEERARELGRHIESGILEWRFKK